MSFINTNNSGSNSTSGKVPRKRKIWRIFNLFLSLLIIVAVSFFAYILANGSKIFDGNLIGRGNLLKALTSNGLQGDKNGRVNILVMGRGGENHPGGLLTDSIMVVSLLPKENKVAMLSIPRDLYVPIKGNDSDKINTAFADGYNNYKDKNCAKKNTAVCAKEASSAGANLTKQTAADVLGIPIHYYFMADFEGFKKLIDNIGGIDVYVEKSLYDPFYPDKNMKGYEPFSIKAGQQHLNGEIALKYSRSRETTSDFDRAARQQKVIMAVKEKVMTLGYLANPKNILDLVSIVGDHIRTDMSATDLKSLADVGKSIDKSKIVTKVLTNGPDGVLVDDSSSGTYYLKPKAGNFSEIKKIAERIFDQSSSTAPENAKIEVLNGSATAGIAGKVGNYLTTNNYTVLSVAQAKTKTQKTIIYDYSNGTKEVTLDFLKDKLKAPVVKKTAPNGTEADISVILGDDFKLNYISQ